MTNAVNAKARFLTPTRFAEKKKQPTAFFEGYSFPVPYATPYSQQPFLGKIPEFDA